MMDIKMCYSLQLTEWLTILNRSQMLSGDMFSLWIGGNQWSVSTLEEDVPLATRTDTCVSTRTVVGNK